MFSNILLAYDGSGQHAAALHQAVELAQLCKAELHLLGVVVTTGTAGADRSAKVNDLFSGERKQIEDALGAVAEDLERQGINVATCIRQGEPAHEIAAHAHEIKADLAVLGHTDKGFLARWFLGSTGAELIRHMPCNLLIITE
ncbi:MAG: universal stress protein [Novosphingobium sp.]|nr:universal stress protein [Novosphingobium sp.]MCP5400920.1 universal stress protein [Novosphingobium sp.]